jgi:hypothetical protein
MLVRDQLTGAWNFPARPSLGCSVNLFAESLKSSSMRVAACGLSVAM